MGPNDRFYSCICLMMLFGTGYVLWVELPAQGKLCPIFVNSVGLPDIHEYFAGCRFFNGPPGFGMSQNVKGSGGSNECNYRFAGLGRGRVCTKKIKLRVANFRNPCEKMLGKIGDLVKLYCEISLGLRI